MSDFWVTVPPGMNGKGDKARKIKNRYYAYANSNTDSFTSAIVLQQSWVSVFDTDGMLKTTFLSQDNEALSHPIKLKMKKQKQEKKEDNKLGKEENSD